MMISSKTLLLDIVVVGPRDLVWMSENALSSAGRGGKVTQKQKLAGKGCDAVSYRRHLQMILGILMMRMPDWSMLVRWVYQDIKT